MNTSDLNKLRDVVDSTKITTYMSCPRKYLYRHVLHWEVDQSSIHLSFGQAWHLAMEHMLLGINRGESYIDSVHEAKRMFRDHLSQEYPNNSHPIKNIENGENALDVYSRLFEADLDRYEVLFTEVPGVVNIPSHTKDYNYFYKIDAIVRDREDGLIYVIDHKTAQQDSEAFRAQWRLSPQVCAYTHMLYSMYDWDEIGGVVINAAFIRKASLDFDRIPTDIGPNHMNRWLTMIYRWVALLDEDYESISTISGSCGVLSSFVPNWTNCTKYGLCPYYDLCISWNNPLQEEKPVGYKYQPWDPREHSAVKEEKKDANTEQETGGDTEALPGDK